VKATREIEKDPEMADSSSPFSQELIQTNVQFTFWN